MNQAAQTIIFVAPASPVTYGMSPITLSATASSSLPITFSATGPATILSSNRLNITGIGTVIVTASQAGNADYTPATPVSYVIVNGFVLPGPGIISTVAGNNQSGNYSCNNVLATTVNLVPTGVAVDAQGNIYIAEGPLSLVCKVTVSTGMISTVAGNGTWATSSGYGDNGPATQAELKYPMGLAVDTYGDIFIADASDNRIRMVTGSS